MAPWYHGTMDSMESMESMDSIEPMDSMGSTESMDVMDSKESMESTESRETTESMDSMESMDSLESMESMDSMNSMDSMDGRARQQKVSGLAWVGCTQPSLSHSLYVRICVILEEILQILKNLKEYVYICVYIHCIYSRLLEDQPDFVKNHTHPRVK